MTDLLAEELIETVEINEDLPIEVPEVPEVQYKKPRSQAQIDALKKANAAWQAKQATVVAKKKEALIETIDLASKSKIEKNQKIIDKQVELAEKRKNRVLKSTPLKPVDEPVEAEVEVEVEVEVEKVEKVKKVKPKKPTIVVQQRSDSDSETDQENIIFIKRRPRKKAPEPIIETPKQAPVPHFYQQPNAFSRPYFYNINSMQ